jgi:N-methylhydantoinase A
MHSLIADSRRSTTGAESEKLLRGVRGSADPGSVARVRFAVDTGGTFTDLVLDDGGLRVFKSPTVPHDPVQGVLDVLTVGAERLGLELSELLARGELLVHGTTRAINAVLTRTTARTAFLTTKGHPDILVFREGGRTRPFDFTRAYPPPYVPRSLTFEVPERIGAAGEIVLPLDEEAVRKTARRLAFERIEAVAVCFLWSTVNPAHERRVGELLEEELPEIPYTLSHALNPTLREYRRAASAAIDASLKPVMTTYLESLERRLREAGFGGRVLVVTSSGGVLDAAAVAAAPIHSINSGPSMAPVAGRFYAARDAAAETAVVADTGGTSYDVSVVRRGRIPRTRESWLGTPYETDLTGFPSVDVKSIGAGGGSIAWVDEGGLLHVGPASAGAVPGPACYGRGGTEPTVTDAALALGYLDEDYFLGGAIPLAVEAARTALERAVARPLELTVEDAAASVLRLATEHMVRAIEDITLNRGIDPRDAVIVGGGGAAGINVVAIARRLGCGRVVIPEFGAALSAAGALMSDLAAEYGATFRTTTAAFDANGANEALAGLLERCRGFIVAAGADDADARIELMVEARYPHQVWELDVPLRVERFESAADVERLRADFHDHHLEVFAVADRESAVEIVGVRARVECRLSGGVGTTILEPPDRAADVHSRRIYFAETGPVDARVYFFEALEPDVELQGPAIVESAMTTMVLDPGAVGLRSPGGALLIDPGASAAARAAEAAAEAVG